MGHVAGQAFCEKATALNLMYFKRLDEAFNSFRAARTRFEELGDESWVAICTNGLGRVEQRRNHFDAARVHFRQALAIQQRIGDRRGQGSTWYFLGFALRADKHTRRRERVPGSLNIRRQIGETGTGMKAFRERRSTRTPGP